MRTETLLEIRNNPYYYKYLRDNSSWYKLINRDIKNLKLYLTIQIRVLVMLEIKD